MTEEERKQQIVDAVFSLVTKRGVLGATTRRIAAAVGVSGPTLYRTFRNRRDMLLAAADAVWQMRRDDLAPAQSANAIEHLRKIGEYHATGIQRPGVVQFEYEFASAPPSEGLRDHMRDQWLKEAQYLIGIVEQGKAQGSIRPDIDAQDTAWRIVNFYWLEANTRLWGPEDLQASDFSKRVLDSILKDIAAAPSEIDS